MPSTGNPELDQYFQGICQQNKKTFGEFSAEYQEILGQQKFLYLAQELSSLQEKLTFNPETKTFDFSKLSFEEQFKYNRIAQEISELLAKLKKKQVKQEQKAKRTKILIGVGCGVAGLGLIGLIVWLITEQRKGIRFK